MADFKTDNMEMDIGPFLTQSLRFKNREYLKYMYMIVIHTFIYSVNIYQMPELLKVLC